MYDNQITCSQPRFALHNDAIYFSKQTDEEQHYAKGKSPAPPIPRK